MQNTSFSLISSPLLLLSSTPPLLSSAPGDKKQMLELGKESEKLKAMKLIIAEMARGTDQTEYFPSVVKCVVCKSLEVGALL